MGLTMHRREQMMYATLYAMYMYVLIMIVTILLIFTRMHRSMVYVGMIKVLLCVDMQLYVSIKQMCWNQHTNAGAQRKASWVTANNFYDYFKVINNPDDRFFQPDDDIIFFNERNVKDEFQVMFQELDVEISMGEINKAVKI